VQTRKRYWPPPAPAKTTPGAKSSWARSCWRHCRRISTKQAARSSTTFLTAGSAVTWTAACLACRP